jgi:hypothetical protein
MEALPHPAAYSPNDADTDARNLATLLDMAVNEGCQMDHTGLTPGADASMVRIHALLWCCREISERLRDGVFSAAHEAQSARRAS